MTRSQCPWALVKIKINASTFIKRQRCFLSIVKMSPDLLPTWGRNIFPAPKRSPTTFMPFIKGPSIICRARGYLSWFNLASSVSSIICFSMPCKRKKKNRGKIIQNSGLNINSQQQMIQIMETLRVQVLQILAPITNPGDSLSFSFLSHRIMWYLPHMAMPRITWDAYTEWLRAFLTLGTQESELRVREGALVSKVQINNKIHFLLSWFNRLHINEQLLWNPHFSLQH